MLLTNQKVYMVRKEDGKWSAFDMDQMSGIMKRFSKDTKSSSAQIDQLKFTDRGRYEAIAGYKGKV